MARVLIIDDHHLARTSLRALVDSCGHEAREAADGREGLALITDFGPDIVITDIVMPNIDGVEIIRRIHDAHPDIKIIAISGGGRLQPESYLEVADVMGVHATLKKPFEREDLEAVMNTALGSRSKT